MFFECQKSFHYVYFSETSFDGNRTFLTLAINTKIFSVNMYIYRCYKFYRGAMNHQKTVHFGS